MADCAAIKTKLDAATAALDSLLKGGAVRVIADSDGSRIEYTSANRSALVAYVQLLQAQYDACIAGSASVIATRPIYFRF